MGDRPFDEFLNDGAIALLIQELSYEPARRLVLVGADKRTLMYAHCKFCDAHAGITVQALESIKHRTRRHDVVVDISYSQQARANVFQPGFQKGTVGPQPG